MRKRFCRIENDKKFLGVCTGIAVYFNIDLILVRILYLFLALIWGAGILLYFVIAIVAPIKYIDDAGNVS
ncbi:MAG: PspC domain-containing protein [Oscillospiraceae bacterium]|jgi:phage shock protein C|nr:PspC domain-containing protein [Oscillospiraceae bacterium]